MKETENILKIFLVGVIFYTFIESFYNLMINVNAYVFMNLSEIMSILPILAITLILIAIIVLIFNTKKLIKPQYRLFLITLIISILRIIAQFLIITPVLLIFNFLILFSGMIFFNEIIFTIQTKKDFLNFNIIVAGIIFGLGIQFIFLMINISSNLTNDFIKLIPVIFLIIGTNIVNIKLFLPENLRLLTEKEEIEKPIKKISYIHFIILGALFLVSMIWMVNPMALSAYGIINFNFLDTDLYFPWFGYGFTYYIFIIFLYYHRISVKIQ